MVNALNLNLNTRTHDSLLCLHYFHSCPTLPITPVFVTPVVPCYNITVSTTTLLQLKHTLQSEYNQNTLSMLCHYIRILNVLIWSQDKSWPNYQIKLVSLQSYISQRRSTCPYIRITGIRFSAMNPLAHIKLILYWYS